MPTVRGALTANFINRILYSVGGLNSTETLKSTLTCDPISNKWTEKAPMPTAAREHLTSAVVNSKLYVIGRRSNEISFNVDAKEVYDPTTNKWTVLEPMPSKRGGLTSAAINGFIYVFGGEQPDGTFNNNEKFDTISNKCTSEKSMPTAKHDGLAAVSFDDKLYMIGDGQQPGGSGSNVKRHFMLAVVVEDESSMADKQSKVAREEDGNTGRCV